MPFLQNLIIINEKAQKEFQKTFLAEGVKIRL